MNEWLKSATFDSWKTTLLGFIGAVGALVVPSLNAGTMPTATQWEIAVLLALFGLCAKSH